MSSALAGYSIVQRIALVSEDDFVFKLTKDQSEAIAFWTLGGRHEITLPIEPMEVTIVDMNGTEVTIHWRTGNLKLRIEQRPQYLFIEPKEREVQRVIINEQPK